MKLRLFVAAAFAAALALPAFAEGLKSGPQAGEKVPRPFHPINVTGEHKGEKFCLFCVNGENPVAMVFARENSIELVRLIKKIDACTVKNSAKEMGVRRLPQRQGSAGQGVDRRCQQGGDQEDGPG